MVGKNFQAARHGEQVWPLREVSGFRDVSPQVPGKCVPVAGLVHDALNSLDAYTFWIVARQEVR